MDEIVKEPIKRLQEIGVSEIAKRTHLEAEYIEAIISKNFEKLKDKNTKAFIKIIEREFDLDMTSWVDEYRAQNYEEEQEKSASFTPVTAKEIAIKDPKKLPKFLFWIALAAIVVWAIFNFKLYDLTIFNGESNSSRAAYSSNTTMVEVAGDKLENVGVEIIKLDEPIVIEPEIKSDLNALEKSIILESTDDNETLFLPDDNATDVEDLVVETEEVVVTGASIVPTENIWIGIIELPGGKKSTVTTAKEYDIDLTKEQLILTGHGLFGLNINGKTETFKDKNPHRLHIKDGKVNQITYDEFLKLNNGKAW